jgi:hypothetical protein
MYVYELYTCTHTHTTHAHRSAKARRIDCIRNKDRLLKTVQQHQRCRLSRLLRSREGTPHNLRRHKWFQAKKECSRCSRRTDDQVPSSQIGGQPLREWIEEGVEERSLLQSLLYSLPLRACLVLHFVRFTRTSTKDEIKKHGEISERRGWFLSSGIYFRDMIANFCFWTNQEVVKNRILSFLLRPETHL